ncbi:hypothetical protein ACJIZ3_018035 [Penstemon smallii]|uniref:UBX domain-containing protein n=1 Tax=Penstemon smallii TaxID=265156 RepID=A0ABD3SYI9_9LAMI
MEQSISSLTFKGSILEAISEAKQQKKLFVVYIAGDNPESKHLETSTWIDPNVSETLAKYCILLHILEGSSEASNFSAIYPQISYPSITAIGYNGARLWQKEGYIAADALASSLEKAWLSLHVQDTTAAFLTAALASKNQFASGSSETTSSEQETPGTHASLPLTDTHTLSLDPGQPSNFDTVEEKKSHEDTSKMKMEENKGREDASKEVDSKPDEAIPKLSHSNVLDTSEADESSSKTGSTSLDPIEKDQNNHEVACPLLGSSNEISQEIASEASEEAPNNTNETTGVEKLDASDSSAIKSNDVFLNIKLPDGVSLQVKFLLMDTLRMVKDHIIDNQTNSIGSFDLAIPYPRKVFNDQDLDSTLSELGLFNRQALVVVPHKETNSHYGGYRSSRQQTYSSKDVSSSNGSEGYWASVKRILSYANPFSYFTGVAGSPSSAQESQSGSLWQYSPNSSLPSNARNAGAPSNAPSSDQGKPSGSRSRPRTSGFGGNIHTLKHDEDDKRFDDKNAFWNGNSTQYGGNNDGK